MTRILPKDSRLWTQFMIWQYSKDSSAIAFWKNHKMTLQPLGSFFTVGRVSVDWCLARRSSRLVTPVRRLATFSSTPPSRDQNPSADTRRDGDGKSTSLLS